MRGVRTPGLFLFLLVAMDQSGQILVSRICTLEFYLFTSVLKVPHIFCCFRIQSPNPRAWSRQHALLSSQIMQLNVVQCLPSPRPAESSVSILLLTCQQFHEPLIPRLFLKQGEMNCQWRRIQVQYSFKSFEREGSEFNPYNLL
jgi:hypothetical protein